MDEYGRKTIHLVFGLLIAGLICLLSRTDMVFILSAGLLGGCIIIDLLMKGTHIPLISLLIQQFERDEVFPGKGTVFFIISALFVTLFFPARDAACSIFVLAVLDGIATIIGIRYGRIRIANHKSLEGSGAAVCVTFFLLLFWFTPETALILSVIAGIVELYSPFDDNLVIPVITAVLLGILP